MKKGHILTALLFLIFSLVPAAGFGENDLMFEQGVDGVEPTANFNSIAAVGSAVYVYDYINFDLYFCDTASEQTGRASAMTDLGPDGDMTRCRLPVRIVGYSGGLYALEAELLYDEEGQTLERLVFSQLEVTNAVSSRVILEPELPDEINDMDLGELVSSITSCAATDSRLYISYYYNETYNGLYVDLKTGASEALDIASPREFSAMDGSHALAVCRDRNAEAAELIIIDDEGGEYSRVASIPLPVGGKLCGFTYLDKSLFYISGGSVMRQDSYDPDSAVRIANCPIVASHGTITETGVYAACDMFFVFIRDTTCEMENIVLHLGGPAFSRGLTMGFLEQNPSLSIESVEQVTNDSINSALLSRSDAVDVYVFATLLSNGFELMRDRGYCLPLESAAVSEALSAMYPNLAEYVTADGVICGMPYDYQMQRRAGVNMDIWRAMGLSDDALPRTWSEFLTFLRDQWPGLSEKNPAYALCREDDNGREMIYAWILNDYNTLLHNSGRGLTYSSEEFRGTMEIFDGMDFSALPNDSEAERGDCLFSFNCFVSPEESYQPFEYLPLSFSADAPPTAPVAMYIAVINPFSSHKEEALAYVEYLATHMTDTARLALCPDAREPILREDLPESAAEFLSEYDALNARIASEGDAALIEARDDMINAHAEYFVATPRSIAAYRERITGVQIVCDYAINETDYEDIYGLRDNYFSGGITLESFINEMDRILSMRVMEDM
jgi:hypothetical protein